MPSAVSRPRLLEPLARSAAGSDAYEYAADGRVHFHVGLGHPIAGQIVRCRCWLSPPADPWPAP
jgi:hypothetical protein